MVRRWLGTGRWLWPVRWVSVVTAVVLGAGSVTTAEASLDGHDAVWADAQNNIQTCDIDYTTSQGFGTLRNILYTSSVRCSAPVAMALVHSELWGPGVIDDGGTITCHYATDPACGTFTLTSGDSWCCAGPDQAGVWNHDIHVELYLRGQNISLPPRAGSDPWLAWAPECRLHVGLSGVPASDLNWLECDFTDRLPVFF